MNTSVNTDSAAYTRLLDDLLWLPPDEDGVSGWRVIPEPVTDDQKPFRPTHLMERVSIEIESNSGQLTKNQAAERAHGKKTSALAAVDILQREGYLVGNSDTYPKYTSVRRYREKDDPASDRYLERDGFKLLLDAASGNHFSNKKGFEVPFPPKGVGNREPLSEQVPGTTSEPLGNREPLSLESALPTHSAQNERPALPAADPPSSNGSGTEEYTDEQFALEVNKFLDESEGTR